MSNSNDPKHVPLVFDEDLAGPIFNNAERNRRIEEQKRRNRERAALSAMSNQPIEVANQSQSSPSTNEPSTGASTSDPSSSMPTSDPSTSASASEPSKSRVPRKGRETKTPDDMEAISAGSCLRNLSGRVRGLAQRPQGTLET